MQNDIFSCEWADKLLILSKYIRTDYNYIWIHRSIIVDEFYLLMVPRKVPSIDYDEHIFHELGAVVTLFENGKYFYNFKPGLRRIICDLRINTIAYLCYLVIGFIHREKNFTPVFSPSDITSLYLFPFLVQDFKQDYNTNITNVERGLYHYLVVFCTYMKTKMVKIHADSNISKTMNTLPLVLITVPHAKCPNINVNNSHPCDISAVPAANLLENFLLQKSIRTKVLIGDINRVEEDLNRIKSRGTIFREKIEKIMKDESGNLLIIDMHSFFEPAFNNAKLAILDERDSLAVAEHTDYIIDLQQTLLAGGFNTQVFWGKLRQNDIMIRARESNVPSLLLEVNEDFLKPDGVGNKYAEEAFLMIAEWIETNKIVKY